MVSEMVEWVAKAITAAEDVWLRQEGDAKDGLAAHPVDALPQAMARAAIEAMREPTDQMEAVGAERILVKWTQSGGQTTATPGLMWQAMIDEALKE